MLDVPAFSYPLYAIQEKDDKFSCLPSRSPKDQTEIYGIVICTHPAIARKYIKDTHIDARPFKIPDPLKLRDLLEGTPPPAFCVALDPDASKYHVGATRSWFGETIEIGDVLQTLPEPFFTWTYPLYVIQTGKNQGAALPDGKEMAMAIFTDIDLAERYQAGGKLHGNLMALADNQAFADFLRKLHSSAVVFDPVLKPDKIFATCRVTISHLLTRLAPLR